MTTRQVAQVEMPKRFQDGDIDSIHLKTYRLKTSKLAKSGSDRESLQVFNDYMKACQHDDVITKCPSMPLENKPDGKGRDT